MKKTPDIAIYRDGIRYRVEIEGKEIGRLRSFAAKIDAYPPDGESEAPHCVIEQYLPMRRLEVKKERLTETVSRNFDKGGEFVLKTEFQESPQAVQE